MKDETISDKRRVLAVDDEPAILNFVGKSLALAGYEVVTTDDAKEAIALAESENPDVVLLDVVMGNMTGFEITERIRSFSQVPIIVFTARSHVAEIAVEAGANACISKPFKPQELIDKIKEVLGD